MPLNRFITVIPLTLSFTLFTIGLSYAPSIAAENPPSASEKPPVPKPPAFDAEAVSQLLDQGRNSEAIQKVEIGWKRQYEDYYHQGNLATQPVEIA